MGRKSHHNIKCLLNGEKNEINKNIKAWLFYK
jgi:hypothetical protein